MPLLFHVLTFLLPQGQMQYQEQKGQERQKEKHRGIEADQTTAMRKGEVLHHTWPARSKALYDSKPLFVWACNSSLTRNAFHAAAVLDATSGGS